MRLSVLNTRLPFLRPTDAKTKVTGDRLSSTVVSILPLTCLTLPLAFLMRMFALFLALLTHAHLYIYTFILSRTHSSISFSVFFPHICSLILSCTRTRLSIFCSLIHISLFFYSWRSRYLVWSVLSTRFLVRNQTFVPSGTSAYTTNIMNDPRCGSRQFWKISRATTAQIGRILRGPLGHVEHLPCSFTVDDVATPLRAQIAFYSLARDSYIRITFIFNENSISWLEFLE